MVYTEKRIEQELHKHGYKVTPQRRVIIGAIIESHEHLTPAALYERALRDDDSIGLVTVYRTIEILAELGFVCEMHTGGNGASYLLCNPAGHHHHLVCSGCGKVVDFTDCDLEKLARRLAKENGFKIENHLLEFSGQCQQCRTSLNKNKRVREKLEV